MSKNPVLPRLYRDVPVIRFGKDRANVQCLDVLRAMRKEPESVEVLLGEIKAANGAMSILIVTCETSKENCLTLTI
jgi:hypothetical protein